VLGRGALHSNHARDGHEVTADAGGERQQVPSTAAVLVDETPGEETEAGRCIDGDA
jgi:hypothetical protein